MIEALDRIDRHLTAGRRAFSADEVAQVWVVHHLEILGEAARGVSAELRAKHPEVPWSTLVAMRAVLVHQYFRVDVDRVWGTMERDLPPLRSALAALVAELDREGPSSTREGAS